MGDTRRESAHGIPQFSGSGFENWKFRVEKLLKSAGLLDAVKKDAPAEAAEARKFQEMDGKATNMIISYIHDDLLDLIREKETAKEVWTTLEGVYAKKSVSSRTLIRKQLAKLKMAEDGSIKDHLKIFDELIRKLKSAGAKLEEGDLVSQLFVTLPESYDPLVTALENLEEDKLTLDTVRERLLAEDMKKSDRMTDMHKEKPSAFIGAKQKPRKFSGKCNRCNKKGHMAKDCRNKIHAEANVASGERAVVSGGKAVAFMSGRASGSSGRRKVIFKLDSGASDHLVNQKECFVALEKMKKPVIIFVAKDDQSITAWHKGKIVGVNNLGVQCTVDDVLYAPDLRANLLSVKKLTKAGVTVLFGEKSAEMIHDGETVCVCPMRGDFYELDIYPEQATASLCVAENADLWHRRLGHLGAQNLCKLTKMVSGITVGPGKLKFCDTCVLGRQCREPFSGTRARAERPLERIHSDVCGPITPKAWDGSRYFVSFIDDFTHFAVILTMKKKSEVFEKFRIYEAMVTAATGHRISKLTVDQGREYCSKEQARFYTEKGIQIEPTVAYTPQQNGVSERFNRTLIEKVRMMLIESKMPKRMWNEAALSGVYIMNRSPTNAVSESKTPIEMWTKQKPDMMKLRVFGCKAYALVPAQQRKKLDSKSQLSVMVGYAPNGYRLWNMETQRLFVARDVKFDEDSFPYMSKTNTEPEPPLIVAAYDFAEEVDSDAAVNQSAARGFEQEGEESDEAGESDDQEDVEPEAVSNTPAALPSKPDPGHNLDMATTRHSERERKLPGKLRDFFVGGLFTAYTSPVDHKMTTPGEASSSALPSRSECRPSSVETSTRPSERERPFRGKSTSMLTETGAISAAQSPCTLDAPTTFDEILGRPDEASWLKAVDDELNSLHSNEVWRLVKRPEGIKPLQSKWVFRVKEDEFGNPIRYKARLVAKGFQQKAGVDYAETYAPVAKQSTIRTALAVSIQKQFHVHQLDVKTAFLYGDLKEDVYMAVPKGVKAPTDVVCKLEKSLYGLKQSPRCWNEKLNRLLLENNFVRSKHDYCLYIRISKDGVLYIIVYVDDILVMGDNITMIEQLKRTLSLKFEMSDCGEVRHFLGIRIRYNRDEGTLTLSMEAAIDKLLAKFGMEQCNAVKIPMDKGLVFPESNCDTNQPYRELLGSMMYIMLCVRPDICYAVGQMGRYQQHPTDSNWQALKKIVRYLKGTKSLQLNFCRKPDASPLTGYADADWASDTTDRKSISGYLFKVYGCTVSWASRKQQTVALSSSEAEYVALSAAASEGIWLKGILENLGVLQADEPFTMYEDNHGCIAMANNTECKRAKHIDIKHHFLRDHVMAGTFRVEPIGTNGQLADTFTKALEAGRFRDMKLLIGLAD